jgi:hypothetical protein
MKTLEDIVEILVGKAPKPLNFRIDRGDLKILNSIAQQITNNIGLTDRQSDLILKKIEKYGDLLGKCGVDVDLIIATPTYRIPMRYIDRTLAIYLDPVQGKKKPKIVIKYVFSKEFAEKWSVLEDDLTHITIVAKNVKEVEYSEQNLLNIVNHLSPLGFEISSEIQELYTKMVEISENPQKFLPYLDIKNKLPLIVNAHPSCSAYLAETFPNLSRNNILSYASETKHCGIFLKSPEFIKEMSNVTNNELTKKILVERSTRFRFDESKNNITELFDTIHEINQWPILIVLDEDSETFSKISSIYPILTKHIPANKISVFFRMKDGQNNAKEFNQFIKDNHLNNYIDAETKCVVISKSRIPKPLLRSEWKPRTAVCCINHDYGKLGVYLNELPTVYYVNNSVTNRHDRLKRNVKIAQL